MGWDLTGQDRWLAGQDGFDLEWRMDGRDEGEQQGRVVASGEEALEAACKKEEKKVGVHTRGHGPLIGLLLEVD